MAKQVSKTDRIRAIVPKGLKGFKVKNHSNLLKEIEKYPEHSPAELRKIDGKPN